MRMLLLKTWRDLMARKGQFVALILLVALGILELRRVPDRLPRPARRRCERANARAEVRRLHGRGARRARRRGGGGRARARRARGRGPAHRGHRPRRRRRASSRSRASSACPVDHRPRVNDLLVEQGRYLPPRARDEALLHSKYANDTGTKVGDTLTLRMGEERRRLQGRRHRREPRVHVRDPREGRRCPSTGRVRGPVRAAARRRGAVRPAGRRHRRRGARSSRAPTSTASSTTSRRCSSRTGSSRRSSAPTSRRNFALARGDRAEPGHGARSCRRSSWRSRRARCSSRCRGS